MAIEATKPQSPGVPPAAAAPQNPTSQLGKQDFMKLLVAQLKNQDPLNPMDSREMISQLATLTSVERLTSLDTSLNQLRSETTGMAGMQTTALIGKKVTAEASRLSLVSGGTAKATYTLNGDAASVSIAVRDSAGNTVRTLELGPQGPGAHGFVWDGMNSGGERVAAGTYSFALTAKAAGGQPVPASTEVSGVVSEVSFKNGAAELVIGDSRVSVGDVISIVQ